VPVILRIALRNLREHRSKTLIIGIIIAVGIAVVVAGNSLAETATRGLRRSFIDNYTGHVMIHGRSAKQLSLFGFGAGTGNEEIPRIGSYPEVFAHVAALPEVAAVSPQLTAFAIPQADEEQNEDFFVMLFGVDAASYGAMFPNAAEIVAGQPLAPGQAGIMVPANLAEEMEQQLGVELQPGDSLLLTAIGGNGLRIRELTISGIFRFQQEMQGLDQVAIIDAQSLRALAGLVVSTGQIELDARETEMLDAGDPDALFADGEEMVEADAAADSAPAGAAAGAAGGAALSEQRVLAILGDRARAPPVMDAGAWHFLLLKLAPGAGSEQARTQRLIDELNGYFAARDIAAEAVDWRAAAGGFSRLAAVMQAVFNGTVVVIAVVAVIIIMNTLVISVIERTSEIGTMRALGAHKRFVRRMFLLETLSISWLFGIAGIVLGAAIVAVLGWTGIRAGNDFLKILFGGEVLEPALSAFSVGISVVIMTAIGLLASVYPVMVALRVQPVRAVQSE
jgi:putative ABC transport system permease protein